MRLYQQGVIPFGFCERICAALRRRYRAFREG